MSKLQNWNTDDETKLINAIGLDVFIDEIGPNPYKYADFNVAIQHAITRRFLLEEVTIASRIPAERLETHRVWWMNSPLIRMLNLPNFCKTWGNFQSIQSTAADNLLAILGSDQLSDSNYLSLINQTLPWWNTIQRN